MRPIQVIEKECRTAVSKSGLPEIDYSVNPYHGCLHSCVYCYAIDFTPETDASTNWGSVVYARTNIDSVLKKEIRRLRKGVFALSTITDPYQPVEARYRLSRKCAEIILSNGFFLTVQTKSPLVTIDMDLWRAHRKSMDVGITITTPDAGTAKIIEPFTPSPEARFRALRELGKNGIPTWVFLGPVIPGINDSEKSLGRIIREASLNGSRLIYDKFNSYSGAAALMAKALGPEKYRDISSRSNADWWDGVSAMIAGMCRDEGVSAVTQQEDWLFERRQKQKDLMQF